MSVAVILFDQKFINYVQPGSASVDRHRRLGQPVAHSRCRVLMTSNTPYHQVRAKRTHMSLRDAISAECVLDLHLFNKTKSSQVSRATKNEGFVCRNVMSHGILLGWMLTAVATDSSVSQEKGERKGSGEENVSVDHSECDVDTDEETNRQDKRSTFPRSQYPYLFLRAPLEQPS